MHTRSKPRQRTAAFTLVELLVVVAIIIALLAMLMPSMGRAVAITQAAACVSNQRQLSLAFLSYAADNHRQLFGVTHNSNSYWFHRLSRQLGIPDYQSDPAAYRRGAMEVMSCPSSEQQADVAGWGFGHAQLDWKFESGTGSYGMNLWYTPNGDFYGDPNVGSTGNFFQSYSDVARTSTTPVFADANWVGAWPSENDAVPADIFYGNTVHTFGQFMGRFAIDRHDRAIGVAFHDGSAGLFGLEDLWTLTWHANWQAPSTPIVIP